MSLDFTKVTYIDGSTVIGADNLNDIQDAILALDSNKVENESGKGLSTEDYTSAEKSKLSGIQAGAQVNPGNATTSVSGLMSSVDKIKLDGIATGATAVTIDNTLAITGQAADAKATGDALAEKYEKPSGGIPKTDLASDVQTSLDKADTALQSHQDISGKADKVQNATADNFAALDANGNLKDSGHKASDFLTEHQSLAAYRTAAAQDTIDAGKQTKITASGILKGNGSGGVSAATAGTDYGTYSKPNTGIPKSDLASDVQASLEKADTALQTGALPAGGADGDVLVKNGATDYAAKWTNTPPQMGSLATIEPTSSASKAYAAGDYLVYNGQLYKVTAAFTAGQTLTPGGNIEAASVEKMLKYTEVTGVVTNVAFQLPAYAREVYVDCAFQRGQHVNFYALFPETDSTRIDSGFYYNASYCGAGSLRVYADRQIILYKPYYGGSEIDAYANIRCWYR